MFKSFLARWRESRVIRKFRRDRAAMLSLCVIGAYTLIFLWTLTVNLDDRYVNNPKNAAKLSWLQEFTKAS